jgi:pimeloyl-ACP methyl ester carboxylesterase
MLCDQDLIDPAVAEVMVDEFRRIYQSAGARLAFLASARNIYLEAPFGRRGFYPRLSELDRPTLFMWGSHDRLIPAGFSRHVAEWLPSAEQVTLDQCGHIPQVERPEETNERLLDFFTRVEALERGGRPPQAQSLDGERKRQRAGDRRAARPGPIDEAA